MINRLWNWKKMQGKSTTVFVEKPRGVRQLCVQDALKIEKHYWMAVDENL